MAQSEKVMPTLENPGASSTEGFDRDTDLLRPELLHELFECQAEARGEAVAVICGRERMTYGELDRESNRLAQCLRRRGIGRGDCVGLLVPRSKDLYVALLAILKTGAAYVPIDPSYP